MKNSSSVRYFQLDSERDTECMSYRAPSFYSSSCLSLFSSLIDLVVVKSSRQKKTTFLPAAAEVFLFLLAGYHGCCH